ncbi:MAG: DNA-binding protein [Mesorhizobium sp.]|nr:MAG: DNA-binding protein [Mesorhizobium sp.]
MTLAEALDRATVSVPDAGRLFFNLARNASYDAAKRGEIPTVKIGGKILVPVAPVAQQLGLRSTAGRKAA